MNQKFFKGDKNYLLEEAQLSCKEELIAQLFAQVREYYFLVFNPLRLEDTTTTQVLQAQFCRQEWQDLIYQQLSAVYRFKNSDNQLSLAFDGRNHVEIYKEEWEAFYRSWAQSMCSQAGLLRVLLKLFVFDGEQHGQEMAVTRLRQAINQHFQVRFHRMAGIKEAVA